VEGKALRTKSLRHRILLRRGAYRLIRTERSIWWKAPS
jgi:hypothetical protein